MPSLFDAKVLSRQVAVLVLGAIPFSVHSWIYPEHRQLSLLAVQQLDGERRPVFDRLWQLARTGDEQRLCASGADLEQGTAPTCIDWAALSAIGGDHSCSSREMFETARSAPWILQVADVSAQLKEDLARIPVVPLPEFTGKPGTSSARPSAASPARPRARSASTRCAPPTSACNAPTRST